MAKELLKRDAIDELVIAYLKRNNIDHRYVTGYTIDRDASGDAVLLLKIPMLYLTRPESEEMNDG